MLETALLARLASLREPPDRNTELEVQSLVWNYVDDRKAAGWQIEQIIVAMKEIALDAGIRGSTFVVKSRAEIATTDQLLAEMVGWCIHRYYEKK